jgi:peptidoglycan/xylan/chitin deacetylase (PgdA/CDA1 family)
MTPGSIAVVITCRDLGRTLLEAIQSVERQTRPAAEIVVIDDGSSDVYTRQVLERLEREGTRVVRGGGHGASSARNLGATLTSSEYLVCLDADDFFEPTYFEAAAARLDGNPELDFISCALRGFGAASYVWSPSLTTFVDAAATNAVPHASTMIRRRFWQKIGGFDESIPSFELLDFWASAIEQGARGEVLEQPFLNYRVRTGSGYRRSIQTTAYRSLLEQFYAKHRAAVERDARGLIVAKEAFLLAQRNHRDALEARARTLEGELSQLQTEIAVTVQTLAAQGLPRVVWGDLEGVQPLSRDWGRDRGTPVDRVYIEAFLARHQPDIRGRVLEIKEPMYTERFGGSAVTSCDVLDIDRTNPRATIIADLRSADAIAPSTYDCIILTQTLHVIDDMHAVLGECRRILKPGGVLLVTAPHVSRIDPTSGLDGDHWRLTEASARKVFAGTFAPDSFEVATYGNVKACAAFLYGLSVEEMAPADLDHQDSSFPLLVSIRAVKPLAESSRTTSATTTVSRTSHPAVILSYHRVADLSPDRHGLCISPDEFRRHMSHVRDHFTPIGLEDLVRASASGTIPKRAVAVTFDDGYLDALTGASPILVALGVPATFFVNSDRLDEPHERWWDVLEGVFSQTQTPDSLTLTIAGTVTRLPTATVAERTAALESLNRAAWPLDAQARAAIARDVLAWSGAIGAPRDTHRVLLAPEVAALAAREGHTVGAHTTHHLALPTQPSDTKRCEVFSNKAHLEQVLHQPVRLFAYPYGDVDADTVDTVRAAGFTAAVTVQRGLVLAGANRLLLPRCEITPADAGRFPDVMRDLFSLQPRQ